MEISSGYKGTPAKNRVVGDMFKLQVAVGYAATISFTLLQGENVAHPDKFGSILFSVLDLDKGYGTIHQWIIAPAVDKEKHGTEVTQTTAEGAPKFIGSRQGNAADNPHNSHELSKEQLSSSIALQYGSAKWTVTLGIDGQDPNGRFFFLSGSTALKESFCP